MVNLPKNAMKALKPEQRELIKEYKDWLLRNGYKEGSVQTLGRKAARYLYLCEQEGWDPADEVSLVRVRKVNHDLSIRAKKFVEFLQERKKTKSVGVEKRELIEEIIKKLSSLEDLLRRSLGKKQEGKGISIEAFVGKPVTVKTVEGKLYSGELLGYDEGMLYILSKSKKKSLIYSINRRIVESLETPAGYFDF